MSVRPEMKRMRDDTVYMVNPIRGKKRIQTCGEFGAALKWMHRWCRGVRTRNIRKGADRIEIVDMVLPDPQGGYWYGSLWRVVG